MTAAGPFPTEAALCAAFIAAIPEGWRVYPESGGFDILLVRSDGTQVGVQAKLTLNAAVVSQIVDYGYDPCSDGPDFRAVLVPAAKAGSLVGICWLVGITVIKMTDPSEEDVRRRYRMSPQEPFRPELPVPGQRYWRSAHDWIEWAPAKRVTLPDYVPDVVAGASAPLQLTDWKIRAIKIAILVERRGSVTRADFKAIGIDYRRWIDPYVKWLARGEQPGVWIAGEKLGTFKAQHPVNYEQIAADFEKWAPKAVQS